jgi:hypothetical protein
MLPRAANPLRKRMDGGALGLKDPRSIDEAKDVVYGQLGQKARLRLAETKPGNRPHPIARIGLNRRALFESAGAAAGWDKW